MDGYNSDKKYESFKIPGRNEVQSDGGSKESPAKTPDPISLDESMYYEIEYGSCPIPGAGKFVLKPHKIEKPRKDETRIIFDQMREIARAHRLRHDNRRFFDPRVQVDNGIIFYKQGMFMKDFSDNYSGNAPFSQYFPYYHMM